MGKQHQPPMTVEQQIENLLSLGLVIEDRASAERFLQDVSYFRFIKAYGIGLKEDGRFCEGVTFEHLKQLYLFNANFRNLLFPEIEKTEVNLRCRLSNYFSCRYGVLGYKDSENFEDSVRHERFLQEIEMEITRNSKAAFVQHFRENYEGGDLPFYALTELFSFGMLSKFFKNLKSDDKKGMERLYGGIPSQYLESWFEHLAFVRNVCAHYGRLYNIRLTKTPKLFRQDKEGGVGNNKVFATLLCLKRLLPHDGHWERFVNKIADLIAASAGVEPRRMGFPSDWQQRLLRQGR